MAALKPGTRPGRRGFYISREHSRQRRSPCTLSFVSPYIPNTSGAQTSSSFFKDSRYRLVSIPLELIVLPYLGAGVGIAELLVVMLIRKDEQSCKVNWWALGEIRAAMVNS